MDETQFLTKSDFKEFEEQLWQRFDYNDALSRRMGERVAVVEALTNKNELRLDTLNLNTKKTAASWAAGVGTAAAGFIYGLISLFWTKGHQ